MLCEVTPSRIGSTRQEFRLRYFQCIHRSLSTQSCCRCTSCRSCNTAHKPACNHPILDMEPAWHSLYGDFIPPTIGLVVGNNLTSSILAIGKIVAIQGIRVAVEIFEAIRNSSIDLLPKLCIVPPLATSRNVRIRISIFVTSLDSTQPNLQLAITATVTHIKCEIPLTLGDIYDNISVRMCRRKHGIVLNKLFSGEIPFLPWTCIVVIGRTCRLTIKNDRAQKHPCSGQKGK